jgi:predicted permease
MQDIAVTGEPAPEAVSGDTLVRRLVTPGYFRALEIPIMRGRGFTGDEASSNEREVVLSQSMAARLFPSGDAIGKQLQLDHGESSEGTAFTVVGIADNVRNAGLSGEDKPEYYRIRRNLDEDWPSSAVFLVQSSEATASIASSVRAQFAKIDPELPVDIETMQQQLSTFSAGPRIEAILLTAFAATGLFLAVIGIYGVTAYIAAQRIREIGVRMALGATRANILLLVLRDGLHPIAAGVICGLAAAISLSHLLHSLLFGVSTHDPASFAGVTLLLIIVALGATLVPARSAMKTDPTSALRHE